MNVLPNEMAHHVRLWRYYPVVKALQAIRGVRLLTAVGTIAELVDLTRFDHPRKLMSYLGLVPSESSTGLEPLKEFFIALFLCRKRY